MPHSDTPSLSEPAAVDFVERLGRLIESDGLPRIAGRLFGVLLLSATDESLDDLSAALEVSKASVSVNARLLLERGLIELVSRPGDRRDYYRVAPDLFRHTMERRLARWRAFHEAILMVRPAVPASAPEVAARLDELDAAYTHVLTAVTDALDAWTRRDRRPRHPASRRPVDL